MQRNMHVPTKSDMEMGELQSRVEACLDELLQILNAKTITNFQPQDPVGNMAWLDENTNILKVWNTKTKTWVAFQPVV
jgi:hypothetical protein